MLVDSHCHLNFPDFKADREDVIARAEEAGIGLMLTICTKMAEFDEILAIAESRSNIFCTVGVHPHEAQHHTDLAVERLIEATKHPKVVGIGETGLDYFYDNSPRAEQRANFRVNLQAARETGLPVVVHTRDADEETAEILTEEVGKGGVKGLLHCFSSGADLARTALDLGFYISFSGIVTFKKAQSVRDVAAFVPANRTLVETDAPFLAPTPHRGKRNEPAYTKLTAETVAQVQGVSFEALEHSTTDNFFTLFDKIDRSAFA